MLGDKLFAVRLELQVLTVVLADQVADPPFRKADAGPELWDQVPLELFGRGIQGAIDLVGFLPTVLDSCLSGVGVVGLRVAGVVMVGEDGVVVMELTFVMLGVMFGFVRLCVRGEFGVEEGRGGGVDGARHEHQAFGEDVGRESEDGVAVDAGVFKVDSGGTVGAYDDLKLFIYIYIYI